MAIGLIPHYSANLDLETFTPGQFLAMGVEAARLLGWSVDYISATGFIANTNKGIFRWNAQVSFKIEGAKAILKSASVRNEMIDLSRNRNTVNAFTTVFTDLKYSLTPEQLGQRCEAIQSEFSPGDKDLLSMPDVSARHQAAGFFSIFIPREGYVVTPVIVYLNILVFILMVISGVSFIGPDTQDLLNWGADFRPLTLSGQWWRLLSSCFLHIGVFHLLFNMYALIYIGLILEPRLGKLKFTTAYLLTGIAASLTSVGWHELIVSAGASGAIFGMYGVFLAMLTTNLIDKSVRKPLLTSIGVFVLYNLLNGMNEGVDNAAHVGRLISGLIIGYSFYPALKEPDSQKLTQSTIGFLTILALISCGIAMNAIPNDLPKYEAKMKTFATNESQALEVYGMLETSSKSKVLNEIQDRAMYYWNQNVQLLQEAEKLHLSAATHEKNIKLITYCDLRIKSCDFLYRAIKDSSSADKDSVVYYNSQIEALAKTLRN